ncbi:Dbl homology domain-containing protein [Syncephalastrum racemosum]|uniref:Dbl homology domain-containing protein n=1 Tax=Syncephalastrum racemosum TaxID=13706 RepID=A0A1X2HUT4_SYNRA|nr:Dbl homology domain-containing protein [Syncephalastrum racemosum]
MPHPNFKFLHHHHHRHSHPQRLPSDTISADPGNELNVPTLSIVTRPRDDLPDNPTFGESISPVPWPEPATAPATPEEKRQQKRHVGWTPRLKRQSSSPADTVCSTVDPPEPPPRLVAFSSQVFAAEALEEDEENYLHRRRCSLSENSGQPRAHSARLSSGRDTASICSSTESNASDQDLDENLLSSLVVPPLRRRSSCPSIEKGTDDMASSAQLPGRTKTISIAEAQYRSRPPINPPSICKRRPRSAANVEMWLEQTHQSKVRLPLSQQQQQQKERQTSIASDTQSRSNSSGSFASTRLSTFSKSSSGSAYDIPPAVDPLTKYNVLDIANIQPRRFDLQRRTSRKKEKRVLRVWQQSVQDALNQFYSEPPAPVVPGEKKKKYALTRRFILREFYTTEVTFWNQLYFTKVMFHDALITALERGSASARKTDLDIFSNLYDLLQFSAALLRRLQCLQFDHDACTKPYHLLMDGADSAPQCVGRTLLDLSECMVVFLRCALDYKANRKLIEQQKHIKGYVRYVEKLLSRKETRQFTMEDYLIIPIQRVARYNLLLMDLKKHTDPNGAEYHDIAAAQKLIAGLASAMNYAQE